MWVCVVCNIGKKLMACRTAADGFSSIVDKVGGEQEKIRARSVHTTHFQKHWPTNLNVVKYYVMYTRM